MSFGLLVNYVSDKNCSRGWNLYPFYWRDRNPGETCDRWKAAVAFTFIAAMLWLASSLLAIWVLYRTRRHNDVVVRRRPWWRRGRY